MIFLTLEDETGVRNVVVWPKVYERFRRIVMGGRLLRASGYLQREGFVMHLIAQDITDMSHKLSELGRPLDEAIRITQPQADDTPRPGKPPPARATRASRPCGCFQAAIFPRCMIPRFDGVILSLEWKEALWDKFVIAAPRPRTPSEQQYSDRKL